MPTRPPVAALIIFDGWGVRKSGESNAIAAAKTPVMDRLYATQAHTEIDASGEAVGLPPGVMGNSEVGHLTIGAGRVIYQDVMRITKAIETGAFSRNPAMLDAISRTVTLGTTLHIWGLLSDGSVHSHIDHLMAILDVAARNGASRIAVHAVLDGRDKPPRSALPFIDQVEAKLKELGRGRIATVTGRYYAMDRDKRWDRVERAWRAIVEGEGIAASSAREAVEDVVRRGQERRIRRAARDRRAHADGRWRPGYLLQLPRRPRARIDRRTRARRILRFRAAAIPEDRLRLHDRIRSIVRLCRWRSVPKTCATRLPKFWRARE